MNATPKLHIVGLGPGAAGLVTGETLDLLRSGIPVILRTRRHPTVSELDPDGLWTACDDLYQGGAGFEEIYEGIAQRVTTAALAGGNVVYAVPGHPLVAERTVTRLLAEAELSGGSVRVYPAVSFADVAAAALRIDLSTVQLCDALEQRIDCQRAALISQVYDRDVATELKLRLLDWYPAEHPVTLLRALGTAESSIRTVPLGELDHQAKGYLDCVYVPALAPLDDIRRFDGLFEVVRRLNAPEGCPWDREQTHASLRPHLLEECYETLAAIDAGSSAEIAEELGDVLLQVLMHAEVAAREDEFSFGDVVAGIAKKLVHRHPHVFGDLTVSGAEEVYQNWDALKQREKARDSVLEGVPETLPALAAAQSMQGRARRTGFDWPTMDGPLEKLNQELREFAEAKTASDQEDEFGDILFVVTLIAERLGIDAEQALRRANTKFRSRFGRLEGFVREAGLDLKGVSPAERLALWERAKGA